MHTTILVCASFTHTHIQKTYNQTLKRKLKLMIYHKKNITDWTSIKLYLLCLQIVLHTEAVCRFTSPHD